MARVTQPLNTVLAPNSAEWILMHAWLHACWHCTPQMLHKQPWPTEPRKNIGSGAKRGVGTWTQSWAPQLRESAAIKAIPMARNENWKRKMVSLMFRTQFLPRWMCNKIKYTKCCWFAQLGGWFAIKASVLDLSALQKLSMVIRFSSSTWPAHPRSCTLLVPMLLHALAKQRGYSLLMTYLYQKLNPKSTLESTWAWGHPHCGKPSAYISPYMKITTTDDKLTMVLIFFLRCSAHVYMQHC